MLGDIVEQALASVGITKERVESWVGGPCGCDERKDKLNALTSWARRLLAGKGGAAYLKEIMGDENGNPPSR